jgi:hypothetical protein
MQKSNNVCCETTTSGALWITLRQLARSASGYFRSHRCNRPHSPLVIPKTQRGRPGSLDSSMSKRRRRSELPIESTNGGIRMRPNSRGKPASSSSRTIRLKRLYRRGFSTDACVNGACPALEKVGAIEIIELYMGTRSTRRRVRPIADEV